MLPVMSFADRLFGLLYGFSLNNDQLTNDMNCSQAPHPGDTFGVAAPPHGGEGWEPAARAQDSYLPLMGRSARIARRVG